MSPQVAIALALTFGGGDAPKPAEAAAKPRCHCPYCPCKDGHPCYCEGRCKCPDCPGMSYATGYERVKDGSTLSLAVGVKAKKGEYQSPPLPTVKPGVYRWYRNAAGVPTCDFILVPSPTELNELYKNGDGIPRFPAVPMFLPPSSPFAIPGCLPGKV